MLTGALQGCLLAMAIRFELRDRRDAKALENGLASQAVANGHSLRPDERTPLLGAYVWSLLAADTIFEHPDEDKS